LSTQTYPSKHVRIRVPSPPSGAIDVAACVVRATRVIE
jgi:hypothetical protein